MQPWDSPYFTPFGPVWGLPFLGFPFFIAGTGSTPPPPATPSNSVCQPYDSNTGSLNLTCLEDRYLQAARERPQIMNYDPAPHCGRGVFTYSDRVYLTAADQDLLQINPSKDPKAAFFRINCKLPTLWESANPAGVSGASLMQNGLLTFAQVKGKTVWVPDYLCTTYGYAGLTIRSEKDFKELQSHLERPFNNEDYNVGICLPPKAPEPEFVPDSSNPLREIRVFERSLTVALGTAAGEFGASVASGSLNSVGEFLKTSMQDAILNAIPSEEGVPGNFQNTPFQQEFLENLQQLKDNGEEDEEYLEDDEWDDSFDEPV